MFWFVRQMLTEHPWLKQFSEIVLLICAAGVLGLTARRWLRQWAGPSNRVVHHSLILLLNRAIPPVLVLMVVTLYLHVFPLSGKAMAVIDRMFYVAVLGVLLYYASRLAHATFRQSSYTGGTPSLSHAAVPAHEKKPRRQTISHKIARLSYWSAPILFVSLGPLALHAQEKESATQGRHEEKMERKPAHLKGNRLPQPRIEGGRS